MTPALRAPVLETERLVLRAHRLEDFDRFAAMWADPAFVRFLGDGQPLSEQEAWRKFLCSAGLWQILGFGFWAIEEKRSRRFIGNIGFTEHRRPTEPVLIGTPEMGWSLAVEAHGQGFAAEAACAALAWSDRCLPELETVCVIHPEHSASIKLAQRCGYRPSRHVLDSGIWKVLFRHPRSSRSSG